MSGRLELFKAAIGNEAYLSEINNTAKNQLHFIITLEENKFTPQELVEMIYIVKDPKIRSLLIISLLSQKDYLSNLKGESIIERIAYGDAHTIPSRLNAWIYQLDVSLLTPDLISRLTAESAASILCSLPHFHLLTESQVNNLISKYPLPSLINYWVKHCALMPNAQYMLVHLMKLIHVNVLDALHELKSESQEAVFYKIIDHLYLFNSLPGRFFSFPLKESYLILAMRHYLSGYFQPIYVTFIEQLMDHLHIKKHKFSSTTIDLLMSLNEFPEFIKLITNSSGLIQNYLKTCAREGSIDLWYQDGHLNIQKMSYLIQTKNLLLDPIDNTAEEECTAVKAIIRHNKSIKWFEYFLMYYQGDIKTIKTIVQDYLSHHVALQKSPNRDQAIHHMSFLLTRNELNPKVKEALFSSFLRNPELLDDFVSSRLLLYNVIEAVQHFGLQGGINNYQTVINLCSSALKKLNHEQHQELIKIALQAQDEAALELKFSQQKGFFSWLFQYVLRCWIYGWKGFFSPRSPSYVLPLSSLPKDTQQLSDPYELHLKDEPPQDLLALALEMVSKSLTQEKLTLLVNALSLYTLKNGHKDEFATRLKVHNLFFQLINEHEKNKTAYLWLMKNKAPFLHSQSRLLELYIQQCPVAEVISFIKQMDLHSDNLKRINEEFNCPVPEQKEQSSEQSATTVELSSTDLMKNVGSYVSNWMSHLSGSLFTLKKTPNAEDPTKTTTPLFDP